MAVWHGCHEVNVLCNSVFLITELVVVRLKSRTCDLYIGVVHVSECLSTNLRRFIIPTVHILQHDTALTCRLTALREQNVASINLHSHNLARQ